VPAEADQGLLRQGLYRADSGRNAVPPRPLQSATLDAHWQPHHEGIQVLSKNAQNQRVLCDI